MKGINYIVDSRNKRKAIVIDLKLIEKERKAIEDLLGTIIKELRKNNKQKEVQIKKRSKNE